MLTRIGEKLGAMTLSVGGSVYVRGVAQRGVIIAGSGDPTFRIRLADGSLGEWSWDSLAPCFDDGERIVLVSPISDFKSGHRGTVLGIIAGNSYFIGFDGAGEDWTAVPYTWMRRLEVLESMSEIRV
ncbi:MAG: hypothetical protein AB7L09_02010 [Nitrospira sp.]